MIAKLFILVLFLLVPLSAYADQPAPPGNQGYVVGTPPDPSVVTVAAVTPPANDAAAQAADAAQAAQIAKAVHDEPAWPSTYTPEENPHKKGLWHGVMRLDHWMRTHMW